MKVIYCGYRATYGAYLMAALHAGIYKEGYLPARQFINAHFDLCRLYGEQYGNLIYVGMDESLNEIYALGCSRFFSVIEKAHAGIGRIFRMDEGLCHIDVSPLEGFLPRFMGFLLARGISTRLCRDLFFWWFRRKYGLFAKAVVRYRSELKGH